MKNKLYLLVGLLTLLFLIGCQSEPQIVEVTRVVTETETVIEEVEVTVEVEGETVTVVEEVEVTRVVEVEAGPAMAEPRGTFRLAHTTIPTNSWWKPWSSNPPAVLGYYEVPYEGLVTEDANGDIVGVLATDWSYNDDNTELTFNLREGVVFHDGTPFNAESVKSNIEYIKNENGFPPTANQLGAVEEVVVDDEYTVTFKLSRPDVALLPNLARFVGLQVSPNAYDTFEAVPVGTGAYKMVPDENTPDQIWVFEGFEDYYDPSAVAFERVELHYIQSPDARTNALLNGDVDATAITNGFLSAVEGAPGIKIDVAPMVGIGFQVLDLNGEIVPELADKRVRCALSHAINRAEYASVLLEGDAVPGVQRETRGQYGYLDNPPDVGYNPERAAALLAEAGVSELNITSGFWGGPFAPLGQGAAGYWAEIGVNVEYENFPPPDMWSNAIAGTYAIQPLPFPEAHLYTMLAQRAGAGPINPSKVVPEGVQELIDQAAGLTLEEAEPLLKEAKAIMIEECIFIHVVTLDGIVAYSDQFTGIDKVPGQPLTFDIKKVRWADGQ